MLYFTDIKQCPMLRFCMAADGDLSALVISGKPETEADINKLAEAFEHLTADYHKIRKSTKYGTILRLVQDIESKRLQLIIYDNCFVYLSYKDSTEMREILERSIYDIKVPEFNCENYHGKLNFEYKKLGRLRIQIEKKQEQLNIISRNEMAGSETAVSSFYKMLQSMALWQMFRDNAQTITIYEYAINESMYLKYVEEQKKNGNKK